MLRGARVCRLSRAGRQLPLKLVIHADRLRQSNTKSRGTERTTCNMGPTTCNLALWSWLVSDGSASAVAVPGYCRRFCFNDRATWCLLQLPAVTLLPAHLPLLCSSSGGFGVGKRMTSVALALPPLPAYQCNILHVAGKQKPRSTSWAFVTVAHTQTHTRPGQTDTLHVSFSVCLFFGFFFFSFFYVCF